MHDFSVRTSFFVVLRTYPFMFVRFAVYFGIASAFIFATGGGAGIGLGIGSLAGPDGRAPGAFWGGIAGFTSVLLMLWWLREYILYLVKAGHIAALLEVLDNRTSPPGQGQIGHAIGLVQRRFIDIHVLFTIDRLVRGSLSALIGSINIGAMIFPSAPQSAASFANKALHATLGFIDEVILAQIIKAAARNPWQSGREAILQYSQHCNVLTKNAAMLVMAAYGLSIVVFLFALGPIMTLTYNFPGNPSLFAFLLATATTWCIKQALLEPFLVASLMQVYFRATEGKHPEADWDTKLATISQHYRELKARAAAAPRG